MSAPQRALALLAAALLAGCGSSRGDAVGELRRLAAAMRQHQAQYAAYPATIDPAQPATASNLPFTPRSGVLVRLVHADSSGFVATAARRPWQCQLQSAPDGGDRLECATLSTTADQPGASTVPPPLPLDTGHRGG